jgi:hypothetical protein
MKLNDLNILNKNKGYFDISLSDREVSAASYIYNEISSILSQRSIESRPKSYIQKVSIEVVRELNIDFITRGMLYYGEILALPPGNEIEFVTFQDTELPKYIRSESDLKLLIKSKCNEFDMCETSRCISEKQHKMHDERFYIAHDRFLNNLETRANTSILFSDIDEILKSFPVDGLTSINALPAFTLFRELARDVLWKSEVYDVHNDVKESFECIWKFIGLNRFYDTVDGDSKDKYKDKMINTEIPCLHEEVKNKLEDLFWDLQTYTRLDNKKLEQVT